MILLQSRVSPLACDPASVPSIIEENGTGVGSENPARWVLEKTCEDGLRRDGYWLTTKDFSDGWWFTVDIGCERFVKKVILVNSQNTARTYER